MTELSEMRAVICSWREIYYLSICLFDPNKTAEKSILSGRYH